MNLRKIRASSSASIGLATILVMLAGIIPALPARADDNPPASSGAGGLTSLASPPPSPGSVGALANVDLATGAAQMSLPFQLPQARGRAQPSLALSYSSSVGVGFAGVGWSLAVPSFVRKGASGMPKFVDGAIGTDPTGDTYFFAGKALVPLCVVDSSGGCGALAAEKFPSTFSAWTYFRSESDDGDRYFFSSDHLTWVIQSKSGARFEFGEPVDRATPGAIESATDAAFLTRPDGTPMNDTAVYRWNLARQYDALGNTVLYQWGQLESWPTCATQCGVQFLQDIYDTQKIGGAVSDLTGYAHHTHLRWSTRDAQSIVAAQSPIWRAQPSARLVGVDVTSQRGLSIGSRELIRRYHLDYSWNPSHTRAYLASFQLEGTCGSAVNEDASGVLPDATPCGRLPATTLAYSPFVTPTPIAKLATWAGGTFDVSYNAGRGIGVVDINGDGRPNALFWHAAVPASGPNPYQVVAALGKPQLIPVMQTPSPPAQHAGLADITPGAPHAVFGDWLADGRVNVLWLDVVPGQYAAANNTYETYSLDLSGLVWRGRAPMPIPLPYAAMDLGNMSAQNGRSIDADGDGLTDIGFVSDWQGLQGQRGMRTFLTRRDQTGAIIPFASQGQLLCTPNLSLPSSYANPAQRLIADMDGDGIVDMVILEAVQDPGSSTFGKGVKAHIFKGRGDGRFGLFGAPLPLSPNQCGPEPLEVLWNVSTAGHEYDSLFNSPVAGGLAGLRDLDGDGLADFIGVTRLGIDVIFHKHTSPPSLPTNADNIDGSGQLVRVTAVQLGWEDPRTQVNTFDAARVQLQFADLDGSGIEELVVVDNRFSGRSMIIDYASEQRGTPPAGSPAGTPPPGTRAGLLQTVSNGVGATTTIAYKSVAYLAPGAPIPQPVWAVTNVTSTNGLAGPQSQGSVTDYTYESPVYDARDRTFLGFKVVTAKRPSADGAPGVNTRTTFTTDTCIACAQMVDYWYRTRRGQVAVTEDFDANTNARLSTTLNTYPVNDLYTGIGMDGRHVRRTWLGTTDTYLWDAEWPGGSSVPTNIMVASGTTPVVTEQLSVWIPTYNKPLRRSAQFDFFGNATDSVDWGLIGSDRCIITHSDWFTVGSTGWSYRPSNRIVGYGDNNGVLLATERRETDFRYDANGLLRSVTAPLSGTLALDRASIGAPPPADRSVDGTITSLQATYDASGNVTQIVRPNGKCTRLAYDGSYNQLPISTSDYLYSCGVGALTTSRVFDRGLEVVTVEVSPAMRMTNVVYDGFGRVVEVDQPDATTPNHAAPAAALKVDYALADVGPVRKIHVSRVTGKAGGGETYLQSWEYVDGFGRALFSLRQDDSGGWIVEGVAKLTSTGRVASAFQAFAYAGAGSSYPTDALPAVPSKNFTYDALGRLLTATEFGTATVSGRQALDIRYYPIHLSSEIRDVAQLPVVLHSGAFTLVRTDGHGRTTVSEQHLANEVVATNSTFLATGELSSVRQVRASDKVNAFRWMAYDSLGRLVLNAEPNTAVNMSLVPNTIGKMKAWRYAYNDSGEIVGTSDARGCGENFIHDQLGRLIAEDFSPCTSAQAPYTPADANTGQGTEAFYVYDFPEIKTGQDPVSYLGELTASYDRAQHSQLLLDARGRVVQVKRQLAKPDAGSASLSSRYTPHWFGKTVGAYDERNHVVTIDTGADLPELAPPGVGSSVTTSYTARDTIATVTSTYGSLLRLQQIDPNGALRVQRFGDVAATTTNYDYFPNGLLSKSALTRAQGPWLPASGAYPPPLSSDPNTVQGELANVAFTYDAVGNPATTTDLTDPTKWPDGAKPVSSQRMKYDSAYRLISNQTDYAGGSDVFIPPSGGAAAYPAPSPVGTRVRAQTFAYDYLGNTSQSDDDADIFGDRSYGAVVNGAMGTLNGPHQLVSTSKKSGDQNATYDAAGNLATLTVHRGLPCSGSKCTNTYNYAWDEVGRLASANRVDGANPTPTVNLRYIYDADGNRVIRAIDDGVPADTLYSVDVFDSLRLEHATYPDASGDFLRTTATESVYLISNGARIAHVVYAQRDLPTATSGRVHVFFEFGNYLGTTSFVVDRDTSELVERTTYQAYGAPDSDYHPTRWDSFREAQGYSGKEDDSEVGLTYFGARYYVASIGRWASADPLTVHAAASDPNPYAYVLGSPMRFTDPSGLDTGPVGCDNLSPGCSNSGFWGDWGNPFGASSGGGDGAGGSGGTIGNNGGRGSYGAGNTSPSPVAGPINQGVPLYQALGSISNYSVNMGAVNAFNAGIDRHSTVIAGAGALAATQTALVASVVEAVGAGAIGTWNAASAGWTAYAQNLGSTAPWAVKAAGWLGGVATAFNGNTVSSTAFGGAPSAAAAGEDLVGVQANRAAGNAFRDEIAQRLVHVGRNVATEVYKPTPFGKRFIDIEVSQGGKVLGGVETKLGSSRYSFDQRAKDAWLWLVDGYRVNVVRRP